MTHSLRNEFEKAFEEWLEALPAKLYYEATPRTCAKWAALWMAEKCAMSIDGSGAKVNRDRIRQMAKELKGEPDEKV